MLQGQLAAGNLAWPATLQLAAGTPASCVDCQRPTAGSLTEGNDAAVGADSFHADEYSLYDGPHTGLEGESAVMCYEFVLCPAAHVVQSHILALCLFKFIDCCV